MCKVLRNTLQNDENPVIDMEGTIGQKIDFTGISDKILKKTQRQEVPDGRLPLYKELTNLVHNIYSHTRLPDARKTNILITLFKKKLHTRSQPLQGHESALK